MTGSLLCARRKAWPVLIAAIAAAGAPARAQQPAEATGAPLTVIVSGLRYDDGTVRVDVCTRETFLRSSCPFGATAKARIGDTSVIVPHVPPGTYAVQAFHDFNNNGEVDRNALGIPQEGIAFSNDPPLGLSGPHFDQAAFQHGDQPQTIRMRLHRFRPAPQRAPSGGGSPR